MSTPSEILTLRSVAVGYPRRGHRALTVLSGITASIGPGRLVGLVGPNGAGKSTLLRSIAGLQPLLGGTVVLEGQPTSTLKRREIARRMAVVLTDRISTGRLRVVDIVRLGRHPHSGIGDRLNAHDLAVVDDALDATGAGELRNADISELSDGQRQRVMVARALAQEPQLLLLDEPTAFLDPPGRVSLLALLRGIAIERQIAMLVCSHDIESLLRYADELWVAGRDTQVTIGGPEDLAAQGALDKAFETAGITFDLHTLGFRADDPAAPWCRVEGVGGSADLACHALQRAGWQVDTYQRHHPDLIVQTGHQWQITEPCQLRASSLEELHADALRLLPVHDEQPDGCTHESVAMSALQSPDDKAGDGLVSELRTGSTMQTRGASK